MKRSHQQRTTFTSKSRQRLGAAFAASIRCGSLIKADGRLNTIPSQRLNGGATP
jgi:hypothetical protein